MYEHTLWTAVVGSRLHGMANADSDTDVRGAYAAALERVIDPWKKQQTSQTQNETVLFELRHLLRLAVAGNWTVLELLESPLMLYTSAAGRVLLQNRRLLRDSVSLLHAALGYAHGQLTDATDAALVARWRVLSQAYVYADTGLLDVAFEPPASLLQLKRAGTDALRAATAADCSRLAGGIEQRLQSKLHPDEQPDYDWMRWYCRHVYLQDG